MCLEKQVLVKKMFTDELNMDLPLWVWVKKTVLGVETFYNRKKKFWVQQSLKKVMLTMHWDMERCIT